MSFRMHDGGAAMGEVVQTMDKPSAASTKIAEIVSVVDGTAASSSPRWRACRAVRASPARARRRLVVQDRREPALDGSQIHSLAVRVVGDLVALDLPHGEVA